MKIEIHAFRSLRSPIMYRCTVCMFQQDSVLLLISHLKNVHNVLPYECHSCGISFLDVHTTTKHFSEASTCTRNDLKINIAPLYATKTNSNCKSSFTLLDEAAKRTAQELFYKSHLNTNITSSSTSNSVPTIMPNEKCDIEQMSNAHISKRYCEENQKILDHTLQEMNYKCTICNWSAKKICAMGEHLRLHAVNPSQSLDDSLSKFFETKIKTQPDGSTTESELSLQTLASMSIPLPIWITPNQSAFKQIHPIPGKIQPNISYTPIPAFREIQQEAIQKLCSLFIDTSIKNSQNAINTIPNFSPSLNSESLCSINSPSSHESVNSSSKSTISDVSTSSSNSLISDVIIKPSEHQYEQRSTLCPAIIVTKSKIQQPNNDDEEPEKKNSLTIIHNQMEEDDFVDVVQIDD
ncbi:unnamed protein product [Thelazia callipaeda]|uniref:C2H2-type domain-containing protein n=1 Tax=Thelazia callipaeda TaxID=103827 RepID=A0A0N5D598_THECL|nr:unnamed protein product [Thelazia callipaeda]